MLAVLFQKRNENYARNDQLCQKSCMLAQSTKAQIGPSVQFRRSLQAVQRVCDASQFLIDLLLLFKKVSSCLLSKLTLQPFSLSPPPHSLSLPFFVQREHQSFLGKRGQREAKRGEIAKREKRLVLSLFFPPLFFLQLNHLSPDP